MQLKADQSMRLVAGKSPVAGVVEIHEMAMDNGVMKMRQIPGIIPAGQTLALKPGSYHVMLLDLKQQVKDGDTVPITLEFVGLDNKEAHDGNQGASTAAQRQRRAPRRTQALIGDSGTAPACSQPRPSISVVTNRLSPEEIIHQIAHRSAAFWQRGRCPRRP